MFHLHVREAGDWDELYFRDHLAAHPEVAREYERVKHAAAERFEHVRDAYTEAKSDFVRSVTAQARAELGGRHVPRRRTTAPQPDRPVIRGARRHR